MSKHGRYKTEKELRKPCQCNRAAGRKGLYQRYPVRQREITAGLPQIFKSGWFVQLCDIDSDSLIKRLTSGANRFLDLTIEKMNEGFISKKCIPKYRAFVCPICGGDVYIKRGRIGYNIIEKKRENIIGTVCKCLTCQTTLKKGDEE